jgi:hypothetical protein
MLVRRSYVKSGNVGIYFDPEEAKKLRDFRSYEWKEFLVVWRKRQLELYEDYVSEITAILSRVSLLFSTVDTWQRNIIRSQTFGLCDSAGKT